MRLSNEWFTALSENESGQLVTVSGRDELTELFSRASSRNGWKSPGNMKVTIKNAFRSACRKDGGGTGSFA